MKNYFKSKYSNNFIKRRIINQFKIIALFCCLIALFFIYLYKSIKKRRTNLNDKKMKYYDFLFNTIQSDYFNLILIYNKSYDTIKIKYKSESKRFINPIICVFGVLVNDEGLKIEKSMLEWLLPEYEVYSVYQKYPGNLYEYPALRFAQWFSLFYNISIILYVHTKGAANFLSSTLEVKPPNTWEMKTQRVVQ